MKVVSRSAIARIMILVLLVALNFGAYRTRGAAIDPTSYALLLGVLPMVQVLGVGYLVGRGSPGSRLFLRGFLAGGLAAMALYVALAAVAGGTLIVPLIQSAFTELLVLSPAPLAGWAFPFAFDAFASLVVLLPQLVPALLGGYWTLLVGLPDLDWEFEPSSRIL
ncbi:hypothetical protein [Tautonia plasticadhaerens]|uniref:Uncharacterized protein n=1 Tax=Tautonia plasticadhaerens TaxID=2527974 RepID=A0A518H0Z1_9BACT|nr:hypothetical protein [Tautonia plasticadhaerens]QDV34492.1 hypothetical protein ElP_23810 [Tautonia plasticadhaerens]